MSWEKSPDFLGWVRQPVAGRYVRHLRESTAAALEALVGAASVSLDPAVRGRWERWKSLSEQTAMLEASRKDTVTDDE